MPRIPASRTARGYVRKADLARDLDLVMIALEGGMANLFPSVDRLMAVDTQGYTVVAPYVAVTGLGIFRWDPTSVTPPDNVNIIQPGVGPAATGPGRWLRTGGGSGTNASQIQGIDVDPTIPVLNQALIYNGAVWAPLTITQDMIAPGYAITFFGVTPSVAEVGQTVSFPAFAAGYTAAPDVTPGSVQLTDTVGNPPKDVTGTPTSFSSDFTFTRNTYGASVGFTLTAKKGLLTRTGGTTLMWLQNIYWGVGSAGGATEAFIKALAGHELAGSKSKTFTVNAGVGQKIYYAFRAAFGTATFFVSGFEGGFLAPHTIPVTNAHGVMENYYLYESVNPNLGVTTVTVV